MGKEWLTGLLGAALAVALARSLLPSGAVGKLGRLMGGLLLLLAALRPLTAGWEGDVLPAWREVLTETRSRQEEYSSLYEALIEEEIQAYAEEEGEACDGRTDSGRP